MCEKRYGRTGLASATCVLSRSSRQRVSTHSCLASECRGDRREEKDDLGDSAALHVRAGAYTIRTGADVFMVLRSSAATGISP